MESPRENQEHFLVSGAWLRAAGKEELIGQVLPVVGIDYDYPDNLQPVYVHLLIAPGRPTWCCDVRRGQFVVVIPRLLPPETNIDTLVENYRI